ncbi:MAG: DNA adenine methylase [Sulfurimonas sp.]|nr:DNA adenine methylase [Sulfurimonas sp.]
MKRLHKLGMPYMGSKRKLAKPLIDFMLKENPNAKYFYDVFGGGGAMSFEAMQRPQIKQTFYNEFNTGVVELLRDIKENGITEKYFKWIDRETFNENKTKDTWLGGFCKVVYSFGNNQKDYLFGKEIEENKRLLHEVVVNKCEESLRVFNDKMKTNIEMQDQLSLFDDENTIARRLRIVGYIKKNKDRFDLQQLERLERLERLDRLQQLEISNKSYELVEVKTPIDETIIYLDPPYENTATYEKSICHKELYEFIENSEYKIYMSSYDSHLPCVLELKHSSSLSATANVEVVEKLFTNNKEELR